jgi:hypothetical protein
VGSYVPTMSPVRGQNPVYSTGYPEGAASGYTKKAPFPQFSQEGNYNGSRGVNPNQLFNNPDIAANSGFDDIYVDLCRDVAYDDTVFGDYTNVLSSTWNQVRDVRGPTDCTCATGSCGNPTHQFEGLWGSKDWNSYLAGGVAPGVSTDSHAAQFTTHNKPYRVYTY